MSNATDELETSTETEHSALDRWVAATDLPMLVLALASIPVLVLELNGNTTVASTALFANWVIWAMFAMDLAVRLWLVGDRRLRYLWQNWFDVLIVGAAVFPLVRPLRAFRSARLLRSLRTLRVVGLLGRFWSGATRFWHGAHGRIVGVAVLVVVLAGSVAVWLVERHTDGPIEGYDDALWWALTTVTTVGYGDAYPVTPEGRGIGALLMLGGIAVFGVVSANLAALFIGRPNENRNDVLVQRIDELTAMVEILAQDREGARDTE